MFNSPFSFGQQPIQQLPSKGQQQQLLQQQPPSPQHKQQNSQAAAQSQLAPPLRHSKQAHRKSQPNQAHASTTTASQQNSTTTQTTTTTKVAPQTQSSSSSTGATPAKSRKPHSLMPQDFEFMKIIGKGSFGKVYLARHKLENKIYAIKVINKQLILRHNEKRHVMAERNVLLQNLRHPFLVAMHYSFQSRDKLYFVLDYANGGEMFYHLSRERVFDEPRARFYAAEITSALGYLHSVGIVYRDLKPENILLDAAGHLMLTDFGLCKEGLYDVLDTTTTFCGTPEYMAPEVLHKEPYDRCVDWWCLGAVLYEMLFGLPPFFSRDRNEMYDNILHAPLRFRHACSPHARSILEALLSKQKQTRLGYVCDAAEVKAHEFFDAIHWPSLEAKQIRPPYNPHVRDSMDVQNIDPIFIDEAVTASVWRQSPARFDSANISRDGSGASHDGVAAAAAANAHIGGGGGHPAPALDCPSAAAGELGGGELASSAQRLHNCYASFRGFSYIPSM